MTYIPPFSPSTLRSLIRYMYYSLLLWNFQRTTLQTVTNTKSKARFVVHTALHLRP